MEWCCDPQDVAVTPLTRKFNGVPEEHGLVDSLLTVTYLICLSNAHVFSVHGCEFYCTLWCVNCVYRFQWLWLNERL